jgi:hypothetical protein
MEGAFEALAHDTIGGVLWWKEKRALGKITLQTIQDLAKNKKTMETREINEALKQKIGKNPRPETLLDKLNHLENYEFVNRDIISIDRQPKLVWKAWTHD